MYKFIKENKMVDKNVVETAINQIEKKYKITFPKLFKDYALSFDGAKIALSSFVVHGYACEVAKIIPICGAGLTFEKIVDNDRSDGFISDSLYPLASTRGGDLYYWNDINGAVYLLLADDIENPFRICDSIEQFFALIG